VAKRRARRKPRKRKKKWIQSATARMKRKGTVGTFTAWCKKQGFSGSTAACIAKGKRSRSASIRKKANFAANVRKRKGK